MGLIKSLLDWAADQVQTTTGEKERREQVARLKQLATEFKNKVTMAIAVLNQIINEFNQAIQRLNRSRNERVKSNIETLYHFLSKFGHCKPIGEYAAEDEKLPAKFPTKNLDDIENYIKNVDWSQDDVFLNTFLLSPIGMKIKTRSQNLSMQEHIHELQLQMEETLNELKIRQFSTQQEIEICTLYISNVNFISEFIQSKILPELELVEAFFQAEKLKNEILCNHALKNIQFSYDVRSIAGTIYDRHYRFIKNAFLFYVISCRVYNTPVLSNLLNSQTSKEDIDRLKNEYVLLENQKNLVTHSMSVARGKK